MTGWWFETTKQVGARTPICQCKNTCQICTDVAEVDEEINQVVNSLRRLLDKRCDLRTEQNRAHDPMHKLPVEIRNHIFELVLPRWDEWGDTIQVEGEEPSRLSSVCRNWRDIVRSNPFFWSTIHISLGKRSTSEWIDFVHNHIMRSGTLPLTFHIEVVDRSKTYLERSRKDLAPVLDAMSCCSNQSQSLSLSLDLPFDILRDFQCNHLPWHNLTQLRIKFYNQISQIDQLLPFLNTTASPERIEVLDISTRSLPISWKRLTSAKVEAMDIEDLTQLFQHASQMTDCHILSLVFGVLGFSAPPIIHYKLKTLSLCRAIDLDSATMFLDSLTLPCLQEVHTDKILLLKCLPALVHRSSCPAIRLTLSSSSENELELIGDLQPMPGVNDVVVLETSVEGDAVMRKLLLEGYFPDMRHLTLRLQPFLSLWQKGVIPLLVYEKHLRHNEGVPSKILVVEQDRALEFDRMWKSAVGENVKSFGMSLREDGFEFL